MIDFLILLLWMLGSIGAIALGLVVIAAIAMAALWARSLSRDDRHTCESPIVNPPLRSDRLPPRGSKVPKGKEAEPMGA